jgi:succinoglycan biosynthesis transport protein ExoP
MPDLLPAGAATFHEPSHTLDLADVVRKLRIRFKLLVTVTLVTFAVLVAGILMMKPKYYAESTIMVISRESRVVSFQQVLGNLPGDLEAVQSEAQVLGSRSLARSVVDALDLPSREEFNPPLGDNPLVAKVKIWITDHSHGWIDVAPKPQSAEAIETGAIDIFFRKLTVEPVGRSRAIRVGFRSEDPELTAAVLNKLTEIYLQDQIESKRSLTRQAKAFLASEVIASRKQVMQADGAVASFRAQNGLYESTKDNLLLSQEVAEVTQELNVVGRRREEAEARASQAANPEALPEVVANQSIGRMREQRAQLQSQALEAEASLGPQNARAVQLRKAGDDLDRRIKQEVAKVAASLNVEADVLRTTERSLTGLLAKLKQELGQSYQAEVQINSLQSEAEVTRALQQSIRTRSQEVSVDEAILQPDAQVLSRADPPVDPSFPQPKLLMALAFVLSTCFGSAVALVAERDNDGMKSMDEVGGALQVRPLGLVPELPGRVTASRYLLDRPESAFAESIQTVLATVILPHKDPVVLLVASAVPGEGKTTTAISLGRLAAKLQRRVLLVDADLRRPSIHKAFEQRNKTGLSDFLDGRASESEIVQADLAPGLSVVFSGSGGADAVRLLSSPCLRDAINVWRTHYDLILFDSPPSASVIDAQLLAVVCDKVVFVAHWNRTRRSLVAAEIQRLKDAGARIAGLVLTHVDVRQHARSDYSDSGAFYASNYYQS